MLPGDAQLQLQQQQLITDALICGRPATASTRRSRPWVDRLRPCRPATARPPAAAGADVGVYRSSARNAGSQ